jgi:O-antigen ligase
VLIFYLKKDWSINKNILISTLLITSFLMYFFDLSHYAIARINLAFNELASYPWNGGVAPETSVGLRITFQRLGWFYFSQSPICGWGSQGYSLIKEAPEVLNFSTQYASDLAFTALFHNELMTQMVRYGLLGILGYIFAVIVPLIISWKYIYSTNQQVSKYALMSSLFIICQILAGLTDEFINLKGMVAFYAYVIAVLIGTQIQLSTTKS